MSLRRVCWGLAIKAITDHIPKQVYVDRGYRAAYLGQKTDVIITGQKRHSKATKRWMKRRNSVEPIIEHLKAGHKMQRNWLKGHLGDIMAPVLTASGFNLKKILRALALFAPTVYERIMALLADFYAKAESSTTNTTSKSTVCLWHEQKNRVIQDRLNNPPIKARQA